MDNFSVNQLNEKIAKQSTRFLNCRKSSDVDGQFKSHK